MAQSYSDIMKNYKNLSVESLGSSLLSRKEDVERKRAKQMRKDNRIQQGLAVLLAGQGLFKNTFKRRNKELEDLQTLNLLNVESHTSKINNMGKFMSVIPENFGENYDFTKPEDVDAATNEFFSNRFNREAYIDKILPLYDSKFSAQFGAMKEGAPSVYKTGAEVAAREMFKHTITDNKHTKFIQGLSEMYFNDDGSPLSRDELMYKAIALKPADATAYITNRHASKKQELKDKSGFFNPNAWASLFKKTGEDLEANGELNIFKNINSRTFTNLNFNDIVQDINFAGVALPAMDAAMAKVRSSNTFYLNTVKGKAFENIRTAVLDEILPSLQETIDSRKAFKKYNFNIDDKDSKMWKQISSHFNDVAGKGSGAIFSSRVAALSERLQDEPELARELLKMGIVSMSSSPEDVSSLIANLQDDTFRLQFSTLLVMKAGAAAEGWWGQNWQWSSDRIASKLQKKNYQSNSLSGLSMASAYTRTDARKDLGLPTTEIVDPNNQTPKSKFEFYDLNEQKIINNEENNDNTLAETGLDINKMINIIDPYISGHLFTADGKATQAYTNLDATGKDIAWWTMANGNILNGGGTMTDLERFNNVTPNPYNVPLEDYMKIKTNQLEYAKQPRGNPTYSVTIDTAEIDRRMREATGITLNQDFEGYGFPDSFFGDNSTPFLSRYSNPIQSVPYGNSWNLRLLVSPTQRGKFVDNLVKIHTLQYEIKNGVELRSGTIPQFYDADAGGLPIGSGKGVKRQLSVNEIRNKKQELELLNSKNVELFLQNPNRNRTISDEEKRLESLGEKITNLQENLQVTRLDLNDRDFAKHEDDIQKLKKQYNGLYQTILTAQEGTGVSEYITASGIGPDNIGSKTEEPKKIETITYKTGATYVGEIKNDSRNGQGTLTFPTGGKYVGEFQDGNYNGQGTYTYPDGSTYVGEWKDDKTHGQGTFAFDSGAKYVGEYKDGKRHGQGTYTYADGTIKKGIWENGSYKEETETSSDNLDGVYNQLTFLESSDNTNAWWKNLQDDPEFSNVKPIITHTIDELLDLTKKNGKYAIRSKKEINTETGKKGNVHTPVGKYQFTGRTLKDINDRDGFEELGWDTATVLFTGENQDKLFVWYINDTIQAATNEAKDQGKKVTQQDIINKVKGRWTATKKMTDEEVDAIISQVQAGTYGK